MKQWILTKIFILYSISGYYVLFNYISCFLFFRHISLPDLCHREWSLYLKLSLYLSQRRYCGYFAAHLQRKVGQTSFKSVKKFWIAGSRTTFLSDTSNKSKWFIAILGKTKGGSFLLKYIEPLPRIRNKQPKTIINRKTYRRIENLLFVESRSKSVL